MTIQPHVNERTARMRRQIATGGVRGTVCGTAGRGGGGVSSAIAPLFSYGMRRSAAACSSRKSHRKLKTPPENRRGFYSGDVLLSHGLSPYYHRGCSVSLPCSEWERVGPLRDSHQKPAPDCGAGFWCVIRSWLHRYNRGFALRNFATVLTFFNVSRFKFQRTARFSDIYIQEVKVDVKASFCF